MVQGSGTNDVDVIVVGAGYGGAAVAALGADQGKRVALLDKTPRAGGKTQTLDGKGYRYEMFGVVHLVGCDDGGRGSGTHQAVDSGFNVAAMLAEDLA